VGFGCSIDGSYVTLYDIDRNGKSCSMRGALVLGRVESKQASNLMSPILFPAYMGDVEDGARVHRSRRRVFVVVVES
jgi:hypothetical protein